MGFLHFLAKIISAAFVVLTISQLARAETYPARPISLVVGFSAGGPSDTIARILAERMRQSIGQPIIVENVTGASGSMAVGRVVHAAPDGYTVKSWFPRHPRDQRGSLQTSLRSVERLGAGIIGRHQSNLDRI